jgi:hypothetical protein
MKALILLFLGLSFLFHASCSNTAEVNDVATVNVSNARADENRNARNVSGQSSETVESSPYPKRKDFVFFDGKNYIKKIGWKVPSRKDAYVDETYDSSPEQGSTTGGKRVYTTTSIYNYKTHSLHSQDFYFEGKDLDYLNGKYESGYFMEISAKGKIFMYTISGKKIVSSSGEGTVSSATSNSDSHEDPFTYRILDKNGDGVFETLVYEDELIVPDWVLK